ncbi:MAG: alpha/beta fold hydrolase [Myxococcota bacterium]
MQPLGSDQPESATVAERDVTASGVRLRVVEGGAGPAVVLVHGLFMDHRTWDGVRADLSRRFRVITPDLPGFGQSEKPPPQRFPYGIDAFVDSIADLYAGLELGRAALVGHGIGGAVALTLAARHPELVSHLVLVSPWLHPDGAAPESQLARLPLLGNLVFKQLVGRGLFRSYFHQRLLWQQRPEASERIDAFYEAFNSPAARGSALATLVATADTRAVLAQTARILTPTLVIGGHSDRLFPPRTGQRLAREIRGAGFELLDAGNAPQEEHPRELAALIARFLQPRSRSSPR